MEGVWILKINAERLGKWRKIDWIEGSGVDTNEKGTWHRVLLILHDSQRIREVGSKS